jgi:hypothetical protein
MFHFSICVILQGTCDLVLRALGSTSGAAFLRMVLHHHSRDFFSTWLALIVQMLISTLFLFGDLLAKLLHKHKWQNVAEFHLLVEILCYSHKAFGPCNERKCPISDRYLLTNIKFTPCCSVSLLLCIHNSLAFNAISWNNPCKVAWIPFKCNTCIDNCVCKSIKRTIQTLGSSRCPSCVNNMTMAAWLPMIVRHHQPLYTSWFQKCWVKEGEKILKLMKYVNGK